MNPPLLEPWPPRISVHVRHRRIGLDDRHHLLHREVHERERSVLRALHAAHDRAGVLLGEEAFREF